MLTSLADLVSADGGLIVRVAQPTAASAQPRTLHADELIGIEQWQSGILAATVGAGTDASTDDLPACLPVVDPDTGNRLATIQTGRRNPGDDVRDPPAAGASDELADGHAISAVRRLDRRGWVDAMTLYRCPGSRPFRMYDRRVADLFWSEVSWLCSPGPRPDNPGSSTVVTDRRGKPLPPRLREVLEGLLGGHDANTIADQLGISPHTVRDHIKRLYADLRVSNREQLVSRCLTFKFEDGK